MFLSFGPLYESPVAREIKKKHSSRLVGGPEMGSQGRDDVARQQEEVQVGKVVTGRPDGAVPHLY